jgi:putative flippase GtrA
MIASGSNRNRRLTGPLSYLESRLVGQSARYLVASIIALAGDIGTYALLLQLHLIPAIAGAIGYGCGLLAHYLLSAAWVFPDRGKRRRTTPTFAKFAATGLSGLGLTALSIALLTSAGLCGPYTAKAIAILLSYVIVFVLRRAYVFAMPGAQAAFNPAVGAPRAPPR